MMSDLSSPDVRFAGLGVSAASADEASRALADRLTAWTADHPNCRILQLSVQTAGVGAGLEMTAIIAYIEVATIVEALAAVAEAPAGDETAEAVLQAVEIVAEAQSEPS